MTGPDEARRLAGPKVVALGGGHGLAASLSALRRVSGRLTAVVTVADDGGSSGRLRRELGVLPPGDLRMALAALCGDDEWGRTWARVLQHRFESKGELHNHAAKDASSQVLPSANFNEPRFATVRRHDHGSTSEACRCRFGAFPVPARHLTSWTRANSEFFP